MILVKYITKRVYCCSKRIRLLPQPFGRSTIFLKYRHWLDEMRYARKANASLLAFLLYRWFCISWSMQITDDERKSNSDDEYRDQVKKLKNYEIVTPAIYNAGELNGEGGSSTIIQITAFGRLYDIVLHNKKTISSYKTYVEYIGINNFYEAKYLRDDECFYSGIANTSNNEPLEVVLNYCSGVEGMIQSNDSLLFIEPIKITNKQKKTIEQKHIVYKGKDVRLRIDEDVLDEQVVNTTSLSTHRRHRRATKNSPYQSYLTFINKSGRTVQLYYLDTFKSHIPFITFVVNEKRSVNTYFGTTWIAKDDRTDQVLLLNGFTEYVAKKNSASERATITITKPVDFKDLNTIGDGELTNSVGGDHHYIEVLVVADDSVIRFHGKNKIEKYILTMMDIAARVFKHQSLGMMIHFQVVRIVLIEDNQAGFTVYKKNPTKTLKSACNFISSLQNPDESDRDHFDFGIALTREDFGPSGFAQLYSMCSSSRSCALVQDEGLTSAFIVAHETGHLLGLEHDGEGEASRCTNEGPRGSIMAPVIVATYDRYRWSTCSREVLKENIEYFQCLKNTPRQRFKPSLRNHGALYSLTEQCQFNFDKDHTTCASFSYNPCRRLWCSQSKSNSCKTMRGPALEGTICGRDKHCSKGECVEFDNRIIADQVDDNEEPKTVHGQWGYWTSWSSCSRTCRVGIRTRRRRCDNPEPSSDGNPCSGKSVQREICNTKKCDVRLILTRQIEQCQAVYGEDWTVYTDKDFSLRLWQARNNPNCTFESGLCNWKNDNTNEINWETNSGPTQSFNTGPSADHTLSNAKGKYIYIEASGTRRHPKQQGDKARLISESISVPRVCFSMHYHMFGRDMGDIRIKMKHRNNSESTLWEQSGNKGDAWHEAKVSIESIGSYKLIIEAVRGQHWASDIAIDDLSAVAGFCPSTKRSRNECKVSCRTRDARQFKMNINVTDGEECGGRRSSNICLDGKCVKFGCDNKFGSKLQLDECGVCGGNGSKCVKVALREEIRPMKDYEILLSLEKGSTFIDILLQYTEVKYYYGLRTKHNNSLKMIMKPEAVAVVANSAFHFTKVDGKQRIQSNGPLSAKVDLIIYTYQQHRHDKLVYVIYEYYKPSVAKFSYTYQNSGWEKCSATCGIGQQRSAVACIRDQDSVVVDKSFCAGMEVPLYIRACHMNPCPQEYKWLTRPWKSCSRSCGGGMRIRIVKCIHVPSNAIVRDHLCTSLPPRSRELCNTNPCPKWHTSSWETCSKSCGSGIQRRQVKCVDQITGNVLDDDKCVIIEKPDDLSPCNDQPCEKYIYIIAEVGTGCTKSCGGGKRLQIIKCIKNSTREEVEKDYCNGPSPPIFADCNTHACPEFKWEVMRSGACSRTCGNGTITQEAACINMDTEQPGDPNNCHGTKPPRFINCNQGDCPQTYKWKVHESSPCSRTCGNGTIIREIVCVDMKNKRARDQDCTDKKLPETIPCYVKKCLEYDVRYSSWGRCSVSCGTGIKRRSFTCLEKVTGRMVSKNLCAKKPIKLERQCTNTAGCVQVDQLYCDFDRRNFCNWKNTKTNDFNWSIDKKTPSVYTGPDYDHTTKQGYFAYIEASLPRKKGEKARLYSPYMQIPLGCFSFWYHMRGEGDMGRLRVLLSTTKSNELLFEKNGHQGTYWLQAKINIRKSGRYRLVIEATRGSGVYSDAAIDDISFHNKECENENRKRTRIYKIPLSCREISPYCRHRNREQYCKGSPAYRNLCCRTCPRLINKKKPNITVVEFEKIKN